VISFAFHLPFSRLPLPFTYVYTFPLFCFSLYLFISTFLPFTRSHHSTEYSFTDCGWVINSREFPYFPTRTTLIDVASENNYPCLLGSFDGRSNSAALIHTPGSYYVRRTQPLPQYVEQLETTSSHLVVEGDEVLCTSQLDFNSTSVTATMLSLSFDRPDAIFKWFTVDSHGNTNEIASQRISSVSSTFRFYSTACM